MEFQTTSNARTAKGVRSMDDLSPRIVAGGAYVSFEQMTWPLPGERMNDLAWRMRYGKPTEADNMYAASIIEAYCQLVVIDTQKVRNGKIQQIRKAHALSAGASGE